MATGRKTHWKMRFVERRKMSKTAIRQWPKHLRYEIEPVAKIPLDRKYFAGKSLNIHASRLRNEEELANLIRDLDLPDGEYYAQGWTHKKTKTHVGYTKHWFRAYVETSETGYKRVTIWDTRRMSHYPFWKERWEKFMVTTDE